MCYLVSKHKVACGVTLDEIRIVYGPILVRLVDFMIVDRAAKRHRPPMIPQNRVVRYVEVDVQVNVYSGKDPLKGLGVLLACRRSLQIDTRFVLARVGRRGNANALARHLGQKSKQKKSDGRHLDANTMRSTAFRS